MDVVALSSTFILKENTLKSMLELLSGQGKTVIVGGVLVNKLNRFRIAQLPFDYCLKTEAEGRFSQILRTIKECSGDEVLHTIPGLFWRRDRQLRESRAPFALIDFTAYRTIPTPEWVSARNGVHQYESVRGCPFRCEFCDYPYLMGNKNFRVKSADQIFEEWQALYEVGVRHVDALDSLFTVPKKRAQRLIELMVHSGLGSELTWACYARVKELADVEFVAGLQKAGCRYIFIGVESGSQSILDNMQKQTTVQQNLRAIEACNGVGLYTSSGILVGFPGETEDTISETADLLMRQSSPSVHIFVWIPDFTEGSPVPIMQPDRKARFDIDGHITPAEYAVPVWGEKIPFSLRTQWRHSTMNQAEALRHACELSNMIRSGAIDGEDFSFAPYRSLILHPSRLAAAMSFSHQRALVMGLKELYDQSVTGNTFTQLQTDLAAWRQASGLNFEASGT